MTIRAEYYDGRRSVSRVVALSIDSDSLRLAGDGVDESYPLDRIELNPPLANTPRLLVLPDGGLCEIHDSAACDALFEGHLDARHRGERWVARLERRMPHAIGAILVLAAATLGIVRFAIPFGAREVVERLDPSLESDLGDQTLAVLDRMALSATGLPESRRARLAHRFDAVSRAAGQSRPLKLVFRSAPDIGPNAFALPGGTIVLLDELVAVATTDDELAAILCHEIGHVQGRHTMRSALQRSATLLVTAAILGDVASLSSYAAAVPAAVLTTSYSREFEREADQYALALMAREGIAIEAFTTILLRLETRESKAGSRFPDFLSSHPATSERIRVIRGDTK